MDRPDINGLIELPQTFDLGAFEDAADPGHYPCPECGKPAFGADSPGFHNHVSAKEDDRCWAKMK